MSAAPAGAVVGIYYDGAELVVGDALRTPTGRTYIVISVRRQARGKHVGRQHLRCAVAEDAAPLSVRVRPLHWYKRGRRNGV